MNYNFVRKAVILNYGESNSSIADYLLECAVELAQNNHLEDAFRICKDALVFVKYTGVDYRMIYVLGLLCEICLNSNKNRMAYDIFLTGVFLIEEGRKRKMDQGSYQEDIDAFLDLKIRIDSKDNEEPFDFDSL